MLLDVANARRILEYVLQHRLAHGERIAPQIPGRDAMRSEANHRAAADDIAKSKVGDAKEAIEKGRERVEDRVRDRLKGLLGR
jgi:hypothetical protein